MDNYFPQSSKGFTLIELLIVIAIIGILSALAAPSFVSTTERFRTRTEMAAFAGDIQFARSEAIKIGAQVQICPSSNGTSCLGANTWQSGWIVYAVPNPIAGAITVLKRQTTWSSSDTLVASPATTSITFNGDGFTTGVAGLTFKLQTARTNVPAVKCLAVAKTGRQKMSESTTAGACS